MLRSGMTLVELLVVLAIVMLLAAATIPRLKPEMDRSRVREAARSIQLYLSSARNQAMATGRSCGVMIEPLPGEPGCAMALSQVETPPPYGGDYAGCTATVTASGPITNGIANCTVRLSSPTSVPLHPNDQIQIGYQGSSLYVSTSQPAGTTSFQAFTDVSQGKTPAWLFQSVTGPYKIWRWPTKSSASALQLPSPAVIDLMWSGVDSLTTTTNNPTIDAPSWFASNSTVTGSSSTPVSGPWVIMFASNGAVDWISNGVSPGGQTVTTSVYLLVGRRDKVVDPVDAAGTNVNNNFNDFTNLWIGINANTGLIVVTDMAATAMGAPPTTAQQYNGSVLQQSRAFARQSDPNGGK